MIVARRLEDAGRDAASVVTVGTFDGVHLAHAEIIREVVTRARMREGRSVVVSFDPHPKQVVGARAGVVDLLSTIDERIALIGALGVDVLLLLEFTYAFSRITPEEFYRSYIVQGTGVDEVIVGYDHMFGRDRAAGIDELVKMGKRFGFSVFAVHPFSVGGETVSSTAIRSALALGDVDRAAQFLGRPYALGATVVRGDGRGKTLGFPTANLLGESPLKIVPADGVYAVGVAVGGEERLGMMNIGRRPTVAPDEPRTMEVHLFDFDREIYGERVVVSFLRRLRDEKKFDSLSDLVRQLERDRDEILRTALLKKNGR
ncbi:MAG TPA: bifunctional riboflavin kinase/FAD synthetase [Bacteroidota bacterium]|nr:bifunctional riboflavin kinase/FAD synthetase [Bacteroidota bacterium]